MALPDIPFSSARQRIVNAQGNVFLVAVTAQDWHAYTTAGLFPGYDNCVAVLYYSGDIDVPGGGSPRSFYFSLAWNLDSPKEIIERQLNVLTRMWSQYYLGQSLLDASTRTFPKLWPFKQFIDNMRGPYRYFARFYGSVHSFTDWVPPMNYIAGGGPPVIIP